MRHGDSKQMHQEKLAAKQAQLVRRGWSESRISQYLKDWGMFNPTTYKRAGK